MPLPISEIIQGILGGIGKLIGALRQSKEAIRLARLFASAIATFTLTYGGAIYVLSLSRGEALSVATLAVILLFLRSPLAENLDIVLPTDVGEARVSLFPIYWRGEMKLGEGGALLPAGKSMEQTVATPRPGGTLRLRAHAGERDRLVLTVFDDYLGTGRKKVLERNFTERVDAGIVLDGAPHSAAYTVRLAAETGDWTISLVQYPGLQNHDFDTWTDGTVILKLYDR